MSIDRICQLLTCWLLAGVVLSAPWLFGGVLTGHQVGFLVAACVLQLAAWCTVASSNREQIWPRSGLAWVVVAAAVWGALQLVPLPPSAHRALSPTGWEWWTAWSGDPASPDAIQDETRYPLSVYPASTRRDLGLLVLPLAVMAGSAVTLCRTQGRSALYVLVALNGALTALFGIIQYLGGNGKLYWVVPLTQGGEPFAAYVNRNHAGAYLNLCLAAGLAWLFREWQAYRGSESTDLAYERSLQSYGGRGFSLAPSTRVAVSLCVCVLITAGVVCSLSRGATVALTAGGLVAMWVLWRVPAAAGLRWAGLSVGMAGLCLAIWMGRAEVLKHRFQGLWSEPSVASAGRLAHWQDALSAASDFWKTGSGLGTYRFAYRPYEDSLFSGWYFHAENQYLEALVDGGLVGLLWMLLAIGILVRAVGRLLRQDVATPQFAVGLAGSVAVATQVVQAIFDFNLYMPANAMLLALLAGSVLAADAGDTARRSRRMWWLLLLAVGMVWSAGGIWELSQVAAADRLRREWPGDAAYPAMAATELDDLIDETEQLAAMRTDDAELLQRLANLHILRYRMMATDALADQLGRERDDFLWQLSDPAVLHGRCHEILRDRPEDDLGWIRREPAITDHLAPAYERLRQARAACPLLPRVHEAIGRLGVLFGDEADGAHVERAIATGGVDPRLLFQTGLLDIQAGRREVGIEKWKSCVELTPDYVDVIVRLGQRLMRPIPLITTLFANQPVRAVEVVDQFYTAPESADVRAAIADMVEQQLADGDEPDADYLRSAVARLRGQGESGLPDLRRAVRRKPTYVPWRYELAKRLLAAGRVPEAIAEARTCLQLDPQPRRHHDLLERALQAAGNPAGRPVQP